jgi:hypothetical protein
MQVLYYLQVELHFEASATIDSTVASIFLPKNI